MVSFNRQSGNRLGRSGRNAQQLRSTDVTQNTSVTANDSDDVTQQNATSTRRAGVGAAASGFDGIRRRTDSQRSSQRSTQGTEAAQRGLQGLKNRMGRAIKKGVLGALIGVTLLSGCVPAPSAQEVNTASPPAATQMVQQDGTQGAGPGSVFALQMQQMADANGTGGSATANSADAVVDDASSTRTHLLQSGETLSSVARDAGISVSELQALNPNLGDPTTLQVGTAIVLPGGDASTHVAQPDAPNTNTPSPSMPTPDTGDEIDVGPRNDVADGTDVMGEWVGLKSGVEGPEVEALQQTLKDQGFRIGVDGDFGPGTEKFVKRVQAAHGLQQTGVVDQATANAIIAGPPAADVAPGTPGVTESTPFGRYAPGSDAAKDLFRQAAPLAGVDASWADSEALHKVLAKETQGRVGVPNYTFGNEVYSENLWGQMHAELRADMVRTSSTATGLGQLTLPNVDAYYPDGRAGIGDPVNEAVGMLRYIADRYGSPERALSFHQTNNWY